MSFLALGKISFSNIPSMLPSALGTPSILPKNFGDGEQVLSDHNALMNTTSKWQEHNALMNTTSKWQDHNALMNTTTKWQTTSNKR